jgi:hypothetical protein
MKKSVLYIHGKGGSAAECEHYRRLFSDCEVFGLDYQTFTPWETSAEIRTAVEKLAARYDRVILIANSIGGFPIITSLYGREAFEFRENSIIVKIPFNWINVMGDKKDDKAGTKSNQIYLSETQKKILIEIRNSPYITKQQ